VAGKLEQEQNENRLDTKKMKISHPSDMHRWIAHFITYYVNAFIDTPLTISPKIFWSQSLLQMECKLQPANTHISTLTNYLTRTLALPQSTS